MPPSGPGVIVRSRFRLLRHLGAGGMGETWLAADEQMRREVVLKAIKGTLTLPERTSIETKTLKRFVREATNMAKVRHANVAEVHEFIDDGVTPPLLVLKFIRGQDLEKTLRAAGGRLPWRTAVTYVLQAAEGVQALHRKPILHRDLKPQNLLLDEHGQVQVIDFGLSKHTGEDVSVTTEGVGSLHYMPPEQWADLENVDIRADVYGLGATLYHLATGRKPYEGFQPMQIMDALAKGLVPVRPRELVPELPEEVERVILAAMEWAAEDRYETAEALAADLRNLLENRPLNRGQTPVARRFGKWVVRKRLPLAAAVTLALYAFVGAQMLWQQQVAQELKAQAEAQTRQERVKAEQKRLQAEQERAAKVAMYDMATAINKFWCEDVLEAGSPFAQADPREMTVAEFFQKAAARLEAGQFPIQEPVIRATVEGTIAQVLADWDENERALRHAEAGRARLARELGPRHPSTLMLASNVAATLRRCGRDAEALPRLRECYEGRKAEIGEDHPDTLHSLDNLTELLMTQPASVPEAEALLRGAVGLRQRRHGDQAPETIMTRINWACSLIRLARWGDAEKQLEITERAIAGLPEAGLDLVLMQANTQSALYRHLKKFPDAERVLRTGLAPVRDRLEPAHAYRVTLEENLAALLEDQGKLREAEQLLQERLAAAQRAGAQAAEQVRLALWLARVVLRQDRPREAEAGLRAAAKLVEGPGHELPRTKTCIRLAECLRRQGKLAPARAMLREAERHLRRTPSADERTWQLLQAEWVALYEESGWSWEAAWWRAFRCPAKP